MNEAPREIRVHLIPSTDWSMPLAAWANPVCRRSRRHFAMPSSQPSAVRMHLSPWPRKALARAKPILVVKIGASEAGQAAAKDPHRGSRR